MVARRGRILHYNSLRTFRQPGVDMRFLVVALCAICALLLIANSTWAQKPKTDPMPPALSARVELDEHEHSFTVRLFLKNAGEKDIDVVTGTGGSGLRVVPQFNVGEITIHPPRYSRPGRRSGKEDLRTVPAGKEILYGTFTMGYPPSDRARTEKLTAFIEFKELKATLRTEPQELKIPATARAK